MLYSQLYNWLRGRTYECVGRRGVYSVHQGRGRLIPSEGYPLQCEWERIALQANLQSSEEEEFEHKEDEDKEKLQTQRGEKRKADNKNQTKKKSDVSKAKEAVKKRKNNSNTMEETGNQIVPKKESFQQNEAKQRKDARE